MEYYFFYQQALKSKSANVYSYYVAVWPSSWVTTSWTNSTHILNHKKIKYFTVFCKYVHMYIFTKIVCLYIYSKLTYFVIKIGLVLSQRKQIYSFSVVFLQNFERHYNCIDVYYYYVKNLWYVNWLSL